MISRLMVTDADDRIWRAMFGKPPAATRIAGQSLESLEDSVVFANRSEIDTAIFMAKPHNGSELSTHFIGRLFSRLIRLPSFITDARNVIASVLTANGLTPRDDSGERAACVGRVCGPAWRVCKARARLNRGRRPLARRL